MGDNKYLVLTCSRREEHLATTFNEVTLSPECTHIPTGCFSGSTIKHLHIPATVRHIGKTAFASSTIQNITFEANSNLVSIGINAFNRANIKQITIPKSIRVLGKGAFSHLSAPLIINFEKGSRLQTIPSHCFAHSEKGLNVYLPSSIRRIEAFAFYQSPITTITYNDSDYENRDNPHDTEIPDTLVASDAMIASNNEDIIEEDDQSTVENPTTSLKYIGHNAFQKADISDKLFYIPSSVEEIDNHAFHHTSFSSNHIQFLEKRRTYVRTTYQPSFIKSSLQKIGRAAFAYDVQEASSRYSYSYSTKLATSKTTIFLPRSLVKISGEAFDNAHVSFEKSMSLVHFSKKSLENKQAKSELGLTYPNKRIYEICSFFSPKFPEIADNSLLEEYSKDTASVLAPVDACDPIQLRFLGQSSFYRATIGTFPQALYLRYIPTKAFVDSNMTHFRLIPEASLVSIGSKAFGSKLVNCVLPANAAYIQSNAFQQATGLSTFRVPPVSVTEGNASAARYIGANAFAGTNLKQFLGPYTKFVGARAFAADRFSLFSLPQVEYLGQAAFFRLKVSKKMLRSMQKIRYISDSAFEVDIDVDSLLIPNTLQHIGLSIFSFSRIRNVYYEEASQAKKIDSFCFNGCILLQKVTLCKSIVEIANAAFLTCRKLVTLDIPNDSALKYIGRYAFRHCVALKSLRLPNGIHAHEEAFFESVLEKIELFAPDGTITLTLNSLEEIQKYFKKIDDVETDVIEHKEDQDKEHQAASQENAAPQAVTQQDAIQINNE